MRHIFFLILTSANLFRFMWYYFNHIQIPLQLCIQKSFFTQILLESSSKNHLVWQWMQAYSQKYFCTHTHTPSACAARNPQHNTVCSYNISDSHFFSYMKTKPRLVSFIGVSVTNLNRVRRQMPSDQVICMFPRDFEIFQQLLSMNSLLFIFLVLANSENNE